MNGNRTGDSRRSRTAPSSALSVPWGNLRRAGLLPLLLTGALLTGSLIAARADRRSDKTDLFLSTALSSHSISGLSSVIVRIEGDLTPAKEAQLKALGADIYRRLPIIHSMALRLPGNNLAGLAALPFVTHLSADLSVKKCDEFTVGS